MNFLKRQVPLILVFLMGIIFIIQYFIPHQWSQNAQVWVNKWISVIGGASLLLGIGSLTHYHYTKIRRRVPGWGYSLVMFLGFIAATLAGFLSAFIWWLVPDLIGVKVSFDPVSEGALGWIFDNMIYPMSATMFSMIGFFIASAAFRAFRARTLEATLLLIAAVIIMLGQTPLGGLIWKGIPDVMTWILTIPTTAAKRALIFGIALGSIAFSLRIILGIERAYFGGKD